MKANVEVSQKCLLTLEEAAKYTGLGMQKLRDLSNNEDCVKEARSAGLSATVMMPNLKKGAAIRSYCRDLAVIVCGIPLQQD